MDENENEDDDDVHCCFCHSVDLPTNLLSYRLGPSNLSSHMTYEEGPNMEQHVPQRCPAVLRYTYSFEAAAQKHWRQAALHSYLRGMKWTSTHRWDLLGTLRHAGRQHLEKTAAQQTFIM